MVTLLLVLSTPTMRQPSYFPMAGFWRLRTTFGLGCAMNCLILKVLRKGSLICWQRISCL